MDSRSCNLCKAFCPTAHCTDNRGYNLQFQAQEDSGRYDTHVYEPCVGPSSQLTCWQKVLELRKRTQHNSWWKWGIICMEPTDDISWCNNRAAYNQKQKSRINSDSEEICHLTLIWVSLNHEEIIDPQCPKIYKLTWITNSWSIYSSMDQQLAGHQRRKATTVTGWSMLPLTTCTR